MLGIAGIILIFLGFYGFLALRVTSQFVDGTWLIGLLLIVAQAVKSVRTLLQHSGRQVWQVESSPAETASANPRPPGSQPS
jgi:membrane-bound ClpP family serine protease